MAVACLKVFVLKQRVFGSSGESVGKKYDESDLFTRSTDSILPEHGAIGACGLVYNADDLFGHQL